MLVPFFVVSRLVNGISPDDSEVRVADAQGFPRSGFVQIDREILGYGFVQGVTDGGAAALTVPTYFGAADDRDDRVGKAAFRGRFGTASASHDQDALVFWFPERYPDWYAPRAEFPELGCLEIDVPARRGWFHSVTWSEHSDDGLVHLVAQARVLGHGGFAGDPEEDPDLFFFEEPGDQGRAHVLDRQGDELLLRFFTEYEDGAADPDAMLRSAWKRTPTLQTLGVEYVAVPVVETHEELP
jgi:hypothetical protein